MTPSEDLIRATIAEQAGEWFIANQAGPLSVADSAAFLGWLKASPIHVQEYLGVARVARRLRLAVGSPEVPLETFLAQVRASDGGAVSIERPGPKPELPRSRRWLPAVATTAALAALGGGLLLLWSMRPTERATAPSAAAVVRFQTPHGEQQTHRLADNSVLHLNTDSAVTVSYSKRERLVTLSSGQADFQVAHESERAFRVFAGPAEVVARGTEFDVRLEDGSTVVTVVEGQVAVGPSPVGKGAASSNQSRALPFVQLAANQQIRVVASEWPATPVAVDAQRSTAWLKRQIAFDHEPLERVAAEFNRYAPKPIEIVTPALRKLEISGVFATDDTEAFIAFLRSLEGVRVEVTATRIRVSRDQH
jgi:transmembrane sensor